MIMKKIPFIAIVSVVLMLLAGIVTFSNQREVMATVNRIEKIENVTSVKVIRLPRFIISFHIRRDHENKHKRFLVPS